MPDGQFDLNALYSALDAQRVARQLTWAAVARDISRRRTRSGAISSSTITGVATRPAVEGDGVLQMLLWLRRTPESFVPGAPDPASPLFRTPSLGAGQVLRWDAAALHGALDERRSTLHLTWVALAAAVGSTPATLAAYAKGGRVTLPSVMRPVLWLGRPAAEFTRIASW